MGWKWFNTPPPPAPAPECQSHFNLLIQTFLGHIPQPYIEMQVF